MVSPSSRRQHRCCSSRSFARLVNSRQRYGEAARRGIVVAGIVGAGHLAALQQKTWLSKVFGYARNIRVLARVVVWVV